MRLTRVYVEEALTGGTRGLVSGNAASHIARVLRLGVGDAVTLFDGRGGEYASRIEGLRKASPAASAWISSCRRRPSLACTASHR